MKNKPKIKIALVEDHQKFRNVLKVVINSNEDYILVGEYSNGKDFLDTYTGDADIILMDIKMPEIGGVDATKLVVNKYPNTNVIALTLNSDKEYAEKMLCNGAKGFVSKYNVVEELDLTIKSVFNE